MNETRVYTQLSSFEKFKAVKDRIQKSNKGLFGTPLTRIERQKQTIEQYYRL